MKIRVLDLCCKAGGASKGYAEAFFDDEEVDNVEVIGVDIEPQPNYPFIFFQGDARCFPLESFDFIHASPPCQAFSIASARWRNAGKEYNDILSPIRERLIESKIPYVIENVVGAPLWYPIRLCGTMFGLRVIRHRLFESNLMLPEPPKCKHVGSVRAGNYVTVAGHGGDGSAKYHDWCEAMGIGWMTKEELAQAIPPSYTYWIAKQVLPTIKARKKLCDVACGRSA